MISTRFVREPGHQGPSTTSPRAETWKPQPRHGAAQRHHTIRKKQPPLTVGCISPAAYCRVEDDDNNNPYRILEPPPPPHKRNPDHGILPPKYHSQAAASRPRQRTAHAPSRPHGGREVCAAPVSRPNECFVVPRVSFCPAKVSVVWLAPSITWATQDSHQTPIAEKSLE